MRTLGLAVLAILVLVGAGCGASQSRVANSSMRPGGILVSGGKLYPTLPTRAGSHSVFRFGCPRTPDPTVAIEACEVQRPLLPAADQRSFTRSQRSWLAYRRRQCNVEFSAYAGGTEASVAGGRCLLRFTAARIADIKASLRLYGAH